MHTDTVKSLLALWRQTRHPRVAELLARASVLAESSEAQALRGAKVDQSTWLEAAESWPAADRGALLATLKDAPAKQVKARIQATAAWGDDPRVADALHHLLDTTPWVSSGTRPTWTQVFARLKALRDPRSRDAAQAFDPTKLGSSWEGPGEYFVAQCTRLADALSDVKAEALTEAQTTQLDAVQADLPESTTPSDPLADVLTHPHDDTLRRVLADLLQNQGDPRGELIALQAKGGTDRKTAARIKKLIKTHRDHLLGPLAPILKVTTIEFHLGFLHRAETKDVVHQAPLDAAMATPLAATIHDLTGPAEVLARPELVGLRVATVAEECEPTALLTVDRPTPIEVLKLPLNGPEDIAALKDTTAFPNLRELTLTGVRSNDILPICATPTAHRVSHLAFEMEDLGFTVPEEVPRDPKMTQAKRLRILHPDEWNELHVELALEREDESFKATVALEFPEPRWVVYVTQMLDWLKATAPRLTGLEATVEVRKGTPEQVAQVEEVARDACLRVIRPGA